MVDESQEKILEKTGKNRLTDFGLADTSRPPFSNSQKTIRFNRQSLIGTVTFRCYFRNAIFRSDE
jgi:hypothetical protein